MDSSVLGAGFVSGEVGGRAYIETNQGKPWTLPDAFAKKLFCFLAVIRKRSKQIVLHVLSFIFLYKENSSALEMANRPPVCADKGAIDTDIDPPLPLPTSPLSKLPAFSFQKGSSVATCAIHNQSAHTARLASHLNVVDNGVSHTECDLVIKYLTLIQSVKEI